MERQRRDAREAEIEKAEEIRATAEAEQAR